jgi:hypothetical protein
MYLSLKQHPPVILATMPFQEQYIKIAYGKEPY